MVLGGAAGLGAMAALGMYITGFQPMSVPATGVLLAGFLVLLMLNAPLAVALGCPALVSLQLLGGAHLLMLPQRLIAGADNFVLLAIPLFILAGQLMETGGISRRLVALALAWWATSGVGWRTSPWWERSSSLVFLAPPQPTWRPWVPS